MSQPAHHALAIDIIGTGSDFLPASILSELPQLMQKAANQSAPVSRAYVQQLIDNTAKGSATLTPEGKINLRHANFEGGDFRGVDFSKLDVAGSNFTHTHLDRKALESLLPQVREGKVSLKGVNLQGADLSGKLVNRADLGIVTLLRFDLSGVNLAGANLSHANLNHITLRGAVLVDADLIGASLQEALLNDAQLGGADFSSADVTKANFSGARI